MANNEVHKNSIGSKASGHSELFLSDDQSVLESDFNRFSPRDASYNVV